MKILKTLFCVSCLILLSACTEPPAQVLNNLENPAPNNIASIKFSKAIDQESALESVKAFHPEKNLKGYFAWKDETTLEYFLENPDDVRSFSVVFQKAIQDKLGKPVEAPTKIDFFPNTKDTKLTFQTPQDGDTDITGKAPITLMWAQPVFILQNPADQQILLKENITITPQIEGSWQMLGSSGLLFEPSENWQGSTQYNINVSPNIGADGINFSFGTPLLKMISNEGVNLINKKPLKINFNQEVDLAKIQEGLALKPSIEFDLSYGTISTQKNGEPTETLNKKVVQITPRNNWIPGAASEIILKKGSYSAEGPLASEAQNQRFSTIQNFMVKNFRAPHNVFGNGSINFSHPVKAEDFLTHLKIYPSENETFWDEYKTQFDFAKDYESQWFSLPPPKGGTWDAGKNYKITIDKALPDTFERVLEKNYQNAFSARFPDEVRPLFMPSSGSVIDKTSDVKISFQYSGAIQSVDVEFKRVFPNPKKWQYSKPLEPSPNQLSGWEMDILKAFPDILDQQDQIGAGKYEANFTFTIAGRSYPSRWNTRFYASDFGVLMKTFADRTVEFSLMDFDGTQIQQGGSIVGYNHEGTLVLDAASSSFPSTLKNPEPVADFLIRVGDQVAVGSESFQRKINPYDARVSFSPWEYNQKEKGIITTDRPLFKPGQKVYLKSILREKNLSGKSFPLKSAEGLNKSYRIEINDPFWKSIGEFEGTTQNGSFDDIFEIPNDAPLGEYQVQVFIDEQQMYNTSFFIQKFRKPKFLIDAEFEQENAIAQDTITAKVGAQYAFGGALKGKKIIYTASLFGQEACGIWDFWCPQKDKVITNGEGILDEKGSFQFPINLDLEEDETDINWNLLSFAMTVYESPNEVSSKTISIPFYESSEKINLDYGKYFYYPGDEAQVSGTVTDLEDKPIAKKNITLGLYKTKWVRNDRKGPDGSFYGEWEQEETEISSQPIKTNDKGVFDITLILPQEGGDYFFKVGTKDDKNRVTTTKQSFWIASKDPITIRQSDENKILSLFTDKEEYNSGETAELFFPISDFEISYARATIERGDVLEDLEVNLENNTIKVVIEDWMAPNVYVSLFLQGTNKNDQSDIRWGAVQVPVTDPSKNLEVSLQFDKEQYQPGDEVTLNLETKIGDKGVPAEVTVAVVDQTLLALKSRRPLNLWKYFLAKVPLAVTTSHTLDQFMSKSAMDAVFEEAELAMDKASSRFGGGGDNKAGGGSQPRGDFRDTATFLASVKTDKEGKATQTFTLPDNLTTWNVWAIGHTLDNAFGEQETQIKSTLPLLISEIIPNFFHLGDQMQAGLLIRRNVPELESEKVTVELQIPSTFQTPNTTKTIEVKDEARVFFPITIPNNLQTLSLEDQMVEIGFEVKGESGLEDSVLLKRKLTMPLTQTTSAESVNAGTKTANAPSINLLPNLSESLLSQIIIDVYSSLANKLEPIVQNIDDKNYGCTEQRFSYVTSVLLQDKLNRVLGKDPLDLEKINIQEHLDYLEESFKGNGFGFWKSSRTPNLWLSAHIVEYASLWEENGYTIDPTKLKQAERYLLTEAQKVCEDENRWHCLSDATRQYAFYVISKLDQNFDLDFAAQYTRDLESKIWWIKTYQRFQENGQELSPKSKTTYRTFWKEIESNIKFRDRYAFWERGSSFYSQDERTTALIYSEMDNHEPLKAFRSKVARYLSETNTKHLSTNSSLYLLQVMGQLAKNEAVNEGASFTIQSDDNIIGMGTLKDLQSIHHQEITADNTTSWPAQFTFLPSNEKAYYADVQLKEVFPSSKSRQIAKGFWIEKEIFHVDDDQYQNPVTELKVGDNYRVRLRVITNTNHRQVNLTDFIPSGAEILNLAFDNVDQRLQSKPNDPWYCRGWCQPQFEHKEFHEDRAQFFMDIVNKGTHEIEYFIRARLPGTFEVKPAKAEQMYFPEVFGTSRGMEIIINE